MRGIQVESQACARIKAKLVADGTPNVISQQFEEADRKQETKTLSHQP